MNLKLVTNQEMDLSFLRENLRDKKDLKLVNPFATYPFNEPAWIEDFHQSPNTISLLLQNDEETIGHAAIRKTKAGKVVVFFVLLSKKHRGKGLGTVLMKEVEKYLDWRFKPTEYFLNVIPTNHIAIGLYKKMGFEVESRSPERVRMRKGLV